MSPSDIFFNSGTVALSTFARVEGGLLELENGHIRRLISTDPRMYLDGKFLPGTEYKTGRRM